jgi:hypothetical protein
MFVKNYKININTLKSGTTATTINIPINMEYQLVDQAELIDRVFVEIETEKAINEIIDYEKIRFVPINSLDNQINSITYTVDLLGLTTYGSIGFDDNDIKFQKESFKQTFLNLNFYDSNNPMNQNLILNITLFSQLTAFDLVPLSGTTGIAGQPLPANFIKIKYVLENPLLNPLGFSEGYFLYDYKDELNVGDSKYLYMRASFKNAKDGKSTNLMVKNTALPIDELIHQLYTRYVLTRTIDGYYFRIDDSYQGSNILTNTHNVSYSNNNNDVTINLYKINAL